MEQVSSSSKRNKMEEQESSCSEKNKMVEQECSSSEGNKMDKKERNKMAEQEYSSAEIDKMVGQEFLCSEGKGGLKKEGVNNNLELFLNDVYEKECVSKTDKEEIKFVQRGIETLVKRIIGQCLADFNTFIRQQDTFMVARRNSNGELEWLSLPREWDSLYLQKYSHINAESVPLIQAGSFYEGTKNGFPDEFDIVFPIASVKVNISSVLLFMSMEVLMVQFNELFENKNDWNFEKSIRYGIKTLSFKQFLEKRGPALKLQFIYNDGLDKDRYIHVDLVPAMQCSAAVNGENDLYRNQLQLYSHPSSSKSFYDRARAAETFLIVEGIVSFVDIEVDFMRNVLSANHKKVYRILKYLINGHGGNEEQEDKHLFPRGRGYCSYHLKIMIIIHHDVCTHSDTEAIGPCVLEVLEEISKYVKASDFPMLLLSSSFGKFILLPYLKTLIKILKAMQTSSESYEYDTQRVESLSSQFIHDKCRSEKRQPVSTDYLEAVKLGHPIITE